MTTILKKPPVWFWIVGVFALLWNLMGVGAYLNDAFMSVDELAKLTQDQRLLYESTPSWATGAFAIAVWAGLLGSIALLLRKKWAVIVLIISLMGALVQNAYLFFMSNAFEVMGSASMFLSTAVISIGVLLVLFAKWAEKKGYI